MPYDTISPQPDLTPFSPRRPEQVLRERKVGLGKGQEL
jgi:hypothetical protein